MAKAFSEILGAEVARVEKLVNFAQAGDNPAVMMNALMAMNCLQAAQFAASKEEKKTKPTRTWDTSALAKQYVDFLNKLP